MIASEGSVVELALRKHVERAVRPVLASPSRKLRMREELLAHLTETYREELERRGNAAAALAAACERFGSPAELTAELDGSVGRIERWAIAIDDWLLAALRSALQFHAGERLWRGALRILAWLAVFNAMVFLVVPAVSTLFHGRPDDPTTLPLLPKLFALIVAWQWLAVLAAQLTERSLERHRGWQGWLGIVWQSIGWSLVLLICAVAFWWSITSELIAAPALRSLALSLFGIVPPLFLCTAWLVRQDQQRRKRLDAWTLLPLDES